MIAFGEALNSDSNARASVSQVLMQPVDATLAPKTGFPVATERRTRIELVERIAPHHPRAHVLSNVHVLTTLVRPNAGRQTVRRIVRLFYGFVGRAEGQDRKHRPEDLFARDAMRL